MTQTQTPRVQTHNFVARVGLERFFMRGVSWASAEYLVKQETGQKAQTLDVVDKAVIDNLNKYFPSHKELKEAFGVGEFQCMSDEKAVIYGVHGDYLYGRVGLSPYCWDSHGTCLSINKMVDMSMLDLRRKWTSPIHEVLKKYKGTQVFATTHDDMLFSVLTGDPSGWFVGDVEFLPFMVTDLEVDEDGTLCLTINHQRSDPEGE